MTSPPTPIVPSSPSTTGTSSPNSSPDVGSTDNPASNNNTAEQPPLEEQPKDDSETVFTPGVIVGVAAVVGVVVIAIVFAISNYRIKVHRDARAQQQQQSVNTEGPTMFTENNSPSFLPPPTPDAAADAADASIMANVVLEPLSQPVPDRTLEAADAFLDPAMTRVSQTPAASVVANSTEKEIPNYKDQVRTMETSEFLTNMPSTSEPE